MSRHALHRRRQRERAMWERQQEQLAFPHDRQEQESTVTPDSSAPLLPTNGRRDWTPSEEAVLRAFHSKPTEAELGVLAERLGRGSHAILQKWYEVTREARGAHRRAPAGLPPGHDAEDALLAIMETQDKLNTKLDSILHELGALRGSVENLQAAVLFLADALQGKPENPVERLRRGG